MADEHNDQPNVGTAGQQSHENEFGPQGKQTLSDDANKGGFSGQSGGTQSGSANADRSNISDALDANSQNSTHVGGGNGQVIGGNDSNSGGATFSQATDFGRQSSSRQALGDGNERTITSDHDSSDSFGRGTTSKPGKSSIVDHQESGGPSGTSGSEAFIGSRDNDASQYLQESSSRSGASSKDATGGADFANQGQGALDREDEQNDGSGVDP